MDSSDLIIGTLRDGVSAASQASTSLTQWESGQIPWVIADDPLIQQILSDKALLSSVWSWLCQQVETCTDATLSPVGRPTNSSRALHVLSTGTASTSNPAFALLERHAASLPDTPSPITPLTPAISAVQQGAAISISAESLSRHAVIFGATGTGKSYLTYLLLREQLLRGCSLVAFDTKLTPSPACGEPATKPVLPPSGSRSSTQAICTTCRGSTRSAPDTRPPKPSPKC